MFFLQDPGGKGFRSVLREHGNHGLRDDGSGIQALLHEMHGTAGKLDAMLPSLVLRVEPGERGQQRRMNIQDLLMKFADEVAAQDPHVPRQANQVYTARPQLVHQLAIVRFPVEPLGCQGDGVQTAILSRNDSWSIGTIGNHHGNFGVQSMCGDGVGDR